MSIPAMEDKLLSSFQAVVASVEALRDDQRTLIASQRRVEQILSTIGPARAIDTRGFDLLREESPLSPDLSMTKFLGSLDSMVSTDAGESATEDGTAMPNLPTTMVNAAHSLQHDPCEILGVPLAVKLEIVSARGLQNLDWVGRSDPYCICTIRGNNATKVLTPVIKDTLEPEWKHTCSIEGYVEGDSLAFTIKDKDNSHQKDELLGRAILPSSLFHKDGYYGDLMLSNCGKGVVAYLRVKVLVVEACDMDKDLEEWTNLLMTDCPSPKSSRRPSDNTSNSDHATKARSLAHTRQIELMSHHSSDASVSALRALHLRLNSLVHSRCFDHVIALLIIMSGLVVGAEVQYSALSDTGELPVEFKLTQVFFCFAFAAELSLRILADGLDFLSSDDKLWNVFDVVVVVSAVAELMLTGLGISDSPFLLFTRVIRIVRIVRIIAVVPALKELKQMIYAIVLTFRSLCYAMLLILMIMYIFSILFTEAASQHVRALDQPLPPYAVLMKDEYGTVPQTLLTLFKSFTGGVNWGTPHSTLLHLPWIFPFLFLIFITFCVFAFLNIITGFFCNNAMDMATKDKAMVIRQQLSDKHKILAEFQEVFSSLDSDGSGDLSLQELEDYMEDPSMVAYFAHLNLEVSNAWDIFKLLDDDESGSISVEEFIFGCLELRGGAKTFDIARLSQQLRITRKELLQCLQKDRVDVDSTKRIERLIAHEALNMKSMERSMQELSMAFAEMAKPQNLSSRSYKGSLLRAFV